MNGWRGSPQTLLVIIGLLLGAAVLPTLSGCTVGTQSSLSRVIEAVGDRLQPLPPDTAREVARFSEVYKDTAIEPAQDRLDYFKFAYKRVRAKYVREVPDAQLVDAAIKGVADLKAAPSSIAAPKVIEAGLDSMIASLDPHSSYMNRQEFNESFIHTKGEFGGLGIEVTMQDGLVKVVAPIEDTPAAKAGVASGDLITHVDGVSIKGHSLSQSVRRMRGRAGTSIRLTLKREGVPDFDLTLKRAVIKVRAVRWRSVGRIGYIRVSRFSERMEGGIVKAFAAIRAEMGREPDGIVLDLRNNPGGLLDQSIVLADAFLNAGEIVSVRGRRTNSGRAFVAQEGDLANGLPMVVLINGGSASASEIVASALKYHGRATVMGAQSFGKGSVQTIIPMPEEGALRLTTALYYGPDGQTIQARGIAPDILIQAKETPAKRRREADLPGSLPAQKAAGANAAPTVSNTACPAIKGGRSPVRSDADGDHTLGCAIAFLEAGSTQKFLAAYGQARSM
ncbi:MAG: S41 family peptidase [Rhodospirillaceae bacterium]|nr:S41 family peptidase [Rhodospirillaceae bacterium]